MAEGLGLTTSILGRDVIIAEAQGQTEIPCPTTGATASTVLNAQEIATNRHTW